MKEMNTYQLKTTQYTITHHKMTYTTCNKNNIIHNKTK